MTAPRYPVFRTDYDVGWIGFAFDPVSLISLGIAAFEELDTPSPKDPVVSHAFVIIGPDTAESAEASGVKQVAVSGYLSYCRLYFARPTGWTSTMGASIASEARRHEGEGYDYALLFSHFLADNPIGKVVNWIGCDLPNRLVSGWLDKKKAEICSELAAKCLQAVMSPRIGCLTMPAREIAPLRLFRDRVVFEQRTGPFGLTP